LPAEGVNSIQSAEDITCYGSLMPIKLKTDLEIFYNCAMNQLSFNAHCWWSNSIFIFMWWQIMMHAKLLIYLSFVIEWYVTIHVWLEPTLPD